MLSYGSVQPAVLPPHPGAIATVHVVKLHRNFDDHPVQCQKNIQRQVSVVCLNAGAGIAKAAALVFGRGIHAALRELDQGCSRDIALACGMETQTIDGVNR
jgi:hypothetical protein